MYQTLPPLKYRDNLTYSVLVEVVDDERIVRTRHAWASMPAGDTLRRMIDMHRRSGNRIEQRTGKLGHERLHRFIEADTGELCQMDDSGVPATEGWVR